MKKPIIAITEIAFKPRGKLVCIYANMISDNQKFFNQTNRKKVIAVCNKSKAVYEKDLDGGIYYDKLRKDYIDRHVLSDNKFKIEDKLMSYPLRFNSYESLYHFVKEIKFPLIMEECVNVEVDTTMENKFKGLEVRIYDDNVIIKGKYADYTHVIPQLEELLSNIKSITTNLNDIEY